MNSGAVRFRPHRTCQHLCADVRAHQQRPGGRRKAPVTGAEGISVRRDLLWHLRRTADGAASLVERQLWIDDVDTSMFALLLTAYGPAAEGGVVTVFVRDQVRRLLRDAAPVWHDVSDLPQPGGSNDGNRVVDLVQAAVARHQPAVVVLGRAHSAASAEVIDPLIATGDVIVVVDEESTALAGSALGLLYGRPNLIVHRTVPGAIAAAHRERVGLGFLAGHPRTLAMVAYHQDVQRALADQFLGD